MRITITEIAKLANVSKSAVSIVLNSKPGVSEKTRARILNTIKKYNYNPNLLAKSLVSKQTKSIGLVIKEIDNPYFSKVMKGVYDTCSQLGFSVLLGSSELSSIKETEIIKTLLNKRVDGLIISPLQNEESNFTYLANLLSENNPVVILGGVKNFFTNSVDIDNVKAAYEAVSFLIKLGHKKIAHFQGPVHSSHGQKRLEGYKQALIDNDIQINKNFIIPVEPYIPGGFNAGMELFLKNIESPTAIFCYNDLVAIGLMNALTEMKIKVPESVSVFGFDNINFSEYIKTPLTTINMPAYEIGKAAASLLIKQIAKMPEVLNEKIILEHKLVERNSCTAHKKNKKTYT